eukprot:TRINITY_DN3543_c0_g2_i1.p1 TRINITY_DN3543_c0_g2~~TRINITY_DN3543_c0_g2_i1.p1  ORF type:complete len:257 (-),score=70.57 TRINITY_DN3543_c0_g2_i1:61-720(-)
MMVPMSIRCTTCGEYIYKGKKFNARKEAVRGELYMGIKIFRFYIKCVRCSNEITIRTDPKRCDYTCEFGAVRVNEDGIAGGGGTHDEVFGDKEEKGMDIFNELEKKRFDSKREMEIMNGLDEIRSLKSRHSKLDPDELLKKFDEQAPKEEEIDLDEEEAALLEMVKANDNVKRIDDFDDDFGIPPPPIEKKDETFAPPLQRRPKKKFNPSGGITLKLKK